MGLPNTSHLYACGRTNARVLLFILHSKVEALVHYIVKNKQFGIGYLKLDDDKTLDSGHPYS